MKDFKSFKKQVREEYESISQYQAKRYISELFVRYGKEDRQEVLGLFNLLVLDKPWYESYKAIETLLPKLAGLSDVDTLAKLLDAGLEVWLPHFDYRYLIGVLEKMDGVVRLLKDDTGDMGQGIFFASISKVESLLIRDGEFLLDKVSELFVSVNEVLNRALDYTIHDITGSSIIEEFKENMPGLEKRLVIWLVLSNNLKHRLDNEHLDVIESCHIRHGLRLLKQANPVLCTKLRDVYIDLQNNAVIRHQALSRVLEAVYDEGDKSTELRMLDILSFPVDETISVMKINSIASRLFAVSDEYGLFSDLLQGVKGDMLASCYYRLEVGLSKKLLDKVIEDRSYMLKGLDMSQLSHTTQIYIITALFDAIVLNEDQESMPDKLAQLELRKLSKEIRIKLLSRLYTKYGALSSEIRKFVNHHIHQDVIEGWRLGDIEIRDDMSPEDRMLLAINNGATIDLVSFEIPQLISVLGRINEPISKEQLNGEVSPELWKSIERVAYQLSYEKIVLLVTKLPDTFGPFKAALEFDYKQDQEAITILMNEIGMKNIMYGQEIIYRFLFTIHAHQKGVERNSKDFECHAIHANSEEALARMAMSILSLKGASFMVKQGLGPFAKEEGVYWPGHEEIFPETEEGASKGFGAYRSVISPGSYRVEEDDWVDVAMPS